MIFICSLEDKNFKTHLQSICSTTPITHTVLETARVTIPPCRLVTGVSSAYTETARESNGVLKSLKTKSGTRKRSKMNFVVLCSIPKVCSASPTVYLKENAQLTQEPF